MIKSTPNPEPEHPESHGVHVNVNVTQGPPASPPSAFVPSVSLIKYAVIGFVVLCAVIGFGAVQLVSAGIITIG